MKLSTRARYALTFMIAVRRFATEEVPVNLERIAGQTGISRRYLEQLAIPLKSQGLLRSVSGRRGGYQLARPAECIRLREIFEATIGPISVVDCCDNPTLCEKSEACQNRLIYMLINQRIREVLDEYSIADLADNERLARLCSSLQVPYPPSAGVPHDPGLSDLCHRILQDKSRGGGP